MKKETLVVVLGFIVICLPYLGIPEELRRGLVVGCGVWLMLLGYLLLRERFLSQIDLGNGERGTDTFVETTERLFAE